MLVQGIADGPNDPGPGVPWIDDLMHGDLFGSYAKEQHHQDSDIDLAVVFENIVDGFETQVELMKMRRNFDTKIKPHVFLESDFNHSNPLANEVLKYGVRLN